MRTPLVSIMMPCYNAAASLPFACASLIAQTATDWECIIVDDGSTDGSVEAATTIIDDRFRIHRLSVNRGRGFARQTALNLANGKYIAMLDADDWWYPAKMQVQLEVLESDINIAIISTGMAITDANNTLIGVRARNTDDIPVSTGYFGKLAMPPLAHAPSMLRSSIAKNFRYDPQFLLAQDVDYLVRYMSGRMYANINSPMYAYSEISSANIQKTVMALGFTRKMFLKHRTNQHLRARYLVATAAAKEVVYRAASAVGCYDLMIQRRSAPPSNADIQAFTHARNSIQHVLDTRTLAK